ncbi:MAG: hypothetical protein GY948_25810 [Alphaproteobacteria bacterium]|nr:hypothetical protein [Alphaproteobacteria bacterium]
MRIPAFKWVVVGSIISIFIGVSIAYAFSDSTTNRAISAGDRELNRCKSIKIEKQKIDCVAKALDTTASSISNGKPDYRPIKRTLRNTAAKLRKTRKKSRARKILAAAAAVLRKAWTRPVYAGKKQLAKKHFAKFAAFVNRAKSVLRS